MVEKDYIMSVADMLLQDSTVLKKNGLWDGRMGKAVFLFNYAQYTGDYQYESHAMNNIELIHGDLNIAYPADYAHGLAGIGAGIEYLAQNRFVKVDTNGVLFDFDERIFYGDVINKKHDNYSLGNGLTGLGQYFLLRINYPLTPKNELRLLINLERMLHVVNIIEHTISLSDPYLPDVLSFLCRLYSLDVCNPKIDRCINKVKDVFSPNFVCAGSQAELVLSLIQMAKMYGGVEKQAVISVKHILQKISETISLNERNRDGNNTDGLFWLLRAKRLVEQTGIDTELIPQFDFLINKEIKQTDNSLENTSLWGCTGKALAMMMFSGKIDDTWLDLLG